MLNILFNIVGIGFIIYGVFILKSKPNKFEEDEYLGDYLDNMDSFQEILDKQQETSAPTPLPDLETGSTYKPATYGQLPSSQPHQPASGAGFAGPTRPKSLVLDRKSQPKEDMDPNSSLKKEIISLSEVGLSNEEIAKKTKKSVREIDILLKLNKIR